MHMMYEVAATAERIVAPLLSRKTGKERVLELTTLASNVNCKERHAALYLLTAALLEVANREGRHSEAQEYAFTMGLLALEVTASPFTTTNIMKEVINAFAMNRGRSKGGIARARKYPTDSEKRIIVIALKSLAKEKGIDIAPASVEIAAELAEGNVSGIAKKYNISPETIRKYPNQIRGKC